MGEVRRVRDLRLRRPVAVKLLPAAVAGDGEGIPRFRRKAQIAWNAGAYAARPLSGH